MAMSQMKEEGAAHEKTETKPVERKEDAMMKAPMPAKKPMGVAAGEKKMCAKCGRQMSCTC